MSLLKEFYYYYSNYCCEKFCICFMRRAKSEQTVVSPDPSKCLVGKL
jgi:hypothetical protein